MSRKKSPQYFRHNLSNTGRFSKPFTITICWKQGLKKFRPALVLSRTMEGPKVPSEAQRREAPRGWDLGRGAVASPQYGVPSPVWGSGKFFKKINVEFAYFSIFLQAEMISYAVAARTRNQNFCSGVF